MSNFAQEIHGLSPYTPGDRLRLLIENIVASDPIPVERACYIRDIATNTKLAAVFVTEAFEESELDFYTAKAEEVRGHMDEAGRAIYSYADGVFDFHTAAELCISVMLKKTQANRNEPLYGVQHGHLRRNYTPIKQIQFSSDVIAAVVFWKYGRNAITYHPPSKEVLQYVHDQCFSRLER